MKIIINEINNKVKGYVYGLYNGSDLVIDPPEGFNVNTDPSTLVYDPVIGTVKTKVPSSVTMRQARLALKKAGLLLNIQTYIDNIADPDEKENVRIAWEYSQTVERNFPLVQTIKTQFGLTDLQIDELFITASTL